MNPTDRPRRGRLVAASVGLAGLSAACGTAASPAPSVPPSVAPSVVPSVAPSVVPSVAPSVAPSVVPATVPATAPATAPSTAPSTAPPVVPTTAPAPSPGGLTSGPGTQATYAVQPQPAPGTCHYRWVGSYPLPDPSCTPGAVNPQVTAADVATTICRSGWTATVRPPEDVTGPEKVGSAAAYGYTGSFSTAEYDHLVPLELGGDPNDPANLWLEPNDRSDATTVTNTKDGLEDRLRELVCAGRLPLAVAQEAIATDWVSALPRYGS